MTSSLERSIFARIIAAKVSGALSMIGSFLIIIDVARKWRRRKNQGTLPTVSRIILGMSLADLWNSFFVHFLGTWMVPHEILDEGFPIPLTAGNNATCTVQAYFSSALTLAGSSTNATLAFTYWLIVCRGKKERDLKNWKWQLLLVYLPWILGLADGTAAVIGFGFHEYNYLWFCDTLSERDSPNKLIRTGGVALLAALINISIIVLMCLLIRFVYVYEKKADAFSSARDTNRRKTIQVTQQGIWFIVAYMAAWLPAMVALILLERLPSDFFVFLACLYPLQGAFNSIVYFRPKYIANRQRMHSIAGRRGSNVSLILATVNIDLPRRPSAELNIRNSKTFIERMPILSSLRGTKFKKSPPIHLNSSIPEEPQMQQFCDGRNDEGAEQSENIDGDNFKENEVVLGIQSNFKCEVGRNCDESIEDLNDSTDFNV